MKREGSRKFERVTADNTGKRLAIVLDGVVYSAPNIQERISGAEHRSQANSPPPKQMNCNRAKHR
jgi:preprotein translocase subunit SecD